MRSPAGAAPLAVSRASFVRRLYDRILDACIGAFVTRHVQRFMSFAPIFNRIARRKIRGLYDICAGFAYSQTLRTCVQLDLFNRVQAAAYTPKELAKRIHIPHDRFLPFLEGACALHLLRMRADGTVALGLNGASVLADPGIAAMVAHHDLLYRDLADPVSFLRAPAGAEMQNFWSYMTADSAQSAAYSDVMADSQHMVSDIITRAYRFAAHRKMVDVGGGRGVFARAVKRASPNTEIHLIDLPHVAELAAQDCRADDHGHGIICHGQDFTNLHLPEDADLVTLIRVIHDQDDAEALHLLSSIYRQMTPGSTLLVAETFRGTPGAEAIGASYFSFFLLGMGRGRLRTRDALFALLEQAGFKHPREHKSAIPEIARVVSVLC